MHLFLLLRQMSPSHKHGLLEEEGSWLKGSQIAALASLLRRHAAFCNLAKNISTLFNISFLRFSKWKPYCFMAVNVWDLDCHAIIFISYGYFSFPRSAYEIRHALARAKNHATTLFWIVKSDLSDSPWRNCEQANIYFNQCTLTNFARWI